MTKSVTFSFLQHMTQQRGQRRARASCLPPSPSHELWDVLLQVQPLQQLHSARKLRDVCLRFSSSLCIRFSFGLGCSGSGCFGLRFSSSLCIRFSFGLGCSFAFRGLCDMRSWN